MPTGTSEKGEERRNGASLPLSALVDQFYARCRRWAAVAGTPRAWSRCCVVTACREPTAASN